MIIIKAKYLIPNPESCIENGAVVVNGTKICSFGTLDNIKTLSKIETIIDLGNAVILPGLINTHTHLDLSNLHNRIKSTSNFTHWAFQIAGTRMRWKEEDHVSSIEKGNKLCIESGSTTVADISNTGHSFQVLKKSPLRKVIYKEVLNFNPDQAKDVINKVQKEMSMIITDSLFSIGLSPHAPYSVSKELYQAIAHMMKNTGIPVCTHVAETQDEIEFLKKGTGNFHVLLKQLRVLNEKWQPPGLTPIQYLKETGILGNHTILIHCNYVTDEEISTIKSVGSSVAFCPRSHHYFGHTNHPIQRLLDAGINVGLGTDSLASNDTLSILDEMKFLYLHYSITPKTLIALATINGAKALGLESKVGQIKEGFDADLCAIKLSDCHADNIYNRLFDIASKNIFTMVAGAICYNASL